MIDGKLIAGLDYPDEQGFEQICSRLKQITETTNDRAMFEALGLKPNSAYGAVKRQQVQPAWIVGAVTKFGASAQWLIFGGNEPSVQSLPICDLQIGQNSQLSILKTAGELPFKRDWLEAKGGYENLLLVRAIGDSMEPTIQPGGLVLLNTALDTPYNGTVFAMTFNQDWHLKRLHFEPGRLVMLSDNNKYPDIDVELMDGCLPEGIKIIGRAVCWWHEEQL